MHFHASKAACTQILFWKEQRFHVHTERVAKLRWCADLAPVRFKQRSLEESSPPLLSLHSYWRWQPDPHRPQLLPCKACRRLRPCQPRNQMLLKRGQGHYRWPLVKTENRKQRRECKSKFKFNLYTKAILKQFKKKHKNTGL